MVNKLLRLDVVTDLIIDPGKKYKSRCFLFFFLLIYRCSVYLFVNFGVESRLYRFKSYHSGLAIMDGNAEEVLDQQPHPESHGDKDSNITKEGILNDEALSPHASDETDDIDNTASESDNELPCATPVTTSSEDADERKTDLESTACPEQDDQEVADISPVADDKPSSQTPAAESAHSDEKSQDPNETPVTKAESKSTTPTTVDKDEAKDVESTESKSQDAIDGEDEDQTKPSNNEDETKPSNDGDETKPVNEEADNFPPLEDEDQNESQKENKDEEQSDSSPKTEQEIDPANISLPESPYFNPFDNKVPSRRGSIDDIPPLDDAPADDEPPVESFAKRDWMRQKEKLGEKNEALDKVMEMVGLESSKMAFLEVKAMIDASRSRQGNLRRQDLNLVLVGNPGTGKATNSSSPFHHGGRQRRATN